MEECLPNSFAREARRPSGVISVAPGGALGRDEEGDGDGGSIGCGV